MQDVKIGRLLTENRGYPSIHQGFGMAHKACALRASHGVFIGWRVERADRNTLYNLYHR